MLLSPGCSWNNSNRLHAQARPEWGLPVTTLEGQPDNFYQVSPSLYRSAQPSTLQFASITALGIKSVINLRSGHSDLTKIDSARLREFRIKTAAGNISKEDVAAFLKVMSNPQNLPVLVHCKYGSDRTGTMCAFYRILHEGWTREEAIAEMVEGGYGFHYIYSKSTLRFIRTADLAEIKMLSDGP